MPDANVTKSLRSNVTRREFATLAAEYEAECLAAPAAPVASLAPWAQALIAQIEKGGAL